MAPLYMYNSSLMENGGTILPFLYRAIFIFYCLFQWKINIQTQNTKTKKQKNQKQKQQNQNQKTKPKNKNQKKE